MLGWQASCICQSLNTTKVCSSLKFVVSTHQQRRLALPGHSAVQEDRDSTQTRFLHLRAADIRGWIFLWLLSSLECRMINNIHGLHKLGVKNSTPPPPIIAMKAICRHIQMFPGKKITTNWELYSNDLEMHLKGKVELKHWQLNVSPWKWHTLPSVWLTKVSHMAILNFKEGASIILSMSVLSWGRERAGISVNSPKEQPTGIIERVKWNNAYKVVDTVPG